MKNVIRPMKRAIRGLRKLVRQRTRLVTDTRYRSYRSWIKHEPEERARYNYALDTESHVFDVGGFKGDFADQIIKEYGSRVTIFEPIPSFAEFIRSRFSNEPRVMLIEGALTDCEGEDTFSIDGDASGAFSSSAEENRVRVQLIKAENYIKKCGSSEFTLMKMNIEGAEYALLEHLISTGLISRFKNLQVQFHLNVPEARQRYKRIARDLRKTHRLDWRYPFIWENWSRKSS